MTIYSNAEQTLVSHPSATLGKRYTEHHTWLPLLITATGCLEIGEMCIKPSVNTGVMVGGYILVTDVIYY